MFNTLDISASGLIAQRVRMDTIQANVANVSTTRDAEGRANPYQRRFPVFVPGGAGNGTGVRVVDIGTDKSSPKLKYDPGHPDAMPAGPQAGFVRMPNVDLSMEMVNAIEAARAYEANITALQISKQMFLADLRVLA